jgi:hypothetical protein
MVDVHSAQELAEQTGTRVAKKLGKKAASTTQSAVEEGYKRYRRKRRARKLERRLTSAAQRLPIDTPIDRRRRSKTAGRVVWLVRLSLVAAIAAALYAAWRSRERNDAPADEGSAPDAFGAAVAASGDGEHAPVARTHP